MSWFFLFKRAVGIAVQPLPVIFCLIALALLASWLDKRRLAVIWSVLAVLLLFAASFPPLVRLAAWPLERRYRPLMKADAAGLSPKFVVVLGNGVAHPGDPLLPALTRLNDCARARLVEGVRLAGLFPEAGLIVSGYGMGLENCADAMAAAAVELGVSPERVLALPESRDTEHEARLVAGIAGSDPVALTTSAAHMPRAAEYFAANGVNFVPAPCDYIGAPSPEVRAAVNRWRWRPRGGTLADSEELWHEYMGLAYCLLFGVGKKAR